MQTPDHPTSKRSARSAAREKVTRAVKESYPAGRALSRIEYFETRRGLPATRFADGRVCSTTAGKPRFLKQATRARAAARPGYYEPA